MQLGCRCKASGPAEKTVTIQRETSYACTLSTQSNQRSSDLAGGTGGGACGGLLNLIRSVGTKRIRAQPRGGHFPHHSVFPDQLANMCTKTRRVPQTSEMLRR